MSDSIVRAVFTDGPGKVKVTEVATPSPGDGEVLVKLRWCGVCGTDLEKVHGLGITSAILGHEEVGEIQQMGDGVTGFDVGDLVFAHHHVPCGVCGFCQRGEGTLCPEYSRHNLVPCGLADSFIVPKYNVERGAILKLPHSLSLEEATFIEPLACCIRGLEKATVRSTDPALIYGAGPVGLLHLKLLKAADPSRSVGIGDVSDYRLSVASRMGADFTFNPAANENGKRASDKFGAGAPALVVLATGSESAFVDALETTARGGTVLLFGAPKKWAQATIRLDNFFLSGARIATSYAATERETTGALNLLSGGKIRVSDMVTHRFPLERSQEAFDIASQQQCIKALISD